MSDRPVTLFTGQWADLPFATVVEKAAGWGFDGLEIATWGDHIDPDAALADPGYLRERKGLLDRHGLGCWALGTHLIGQAVCDPIDVRHRAILPARIWGDGEPEGVRRRAADEMITIGKVAAAFGVETVVGFTGSSIWHMLAGFPPISEEVYEGGYRDFAERWTPILDAYEREGVRFALEVHPCEIAYDFWTTEKTLEAIGNHPAFGLNFDPSHLNWQGLDPAAFLLEFGERVLHVHCKDSAVKLDGRNGILSSHLQFGDPRRGWDFRSVGRGTVDWNELFRTLNQIGYRGPLSVEWEDAQLDRESAVVEALANVRRLALPGSSRVFDEAFLREEESNR